MANMGQYMPVELPSRPSLRLHQPARATRASQAGGSLKPLLVAKLGCAMLSVHKCSTNGGEACKIESFLGHLSLCLIGLLGLLNLQLTSNHSEHPSTLQACSLFPRFKADTVSLDVAFG